MGESSTLTFTSVILMVFYLFTGLTGCSVNPRNSRGAYKLARTPRVIKKKKLWEKNAVQDHHSRREQMPPCIGKLPKSKINWDDWRHYNNNNNKLNQNQRVGTMMSNNVFLIETLDYNNNNNKNYNFASHDKNIWFGWWGNKIFYNFWTIKLLLEPNSLELFWLFIFIFKCIINLLDCSYVKRTLTLVPYHNELWFLFFTLLCHFCWLSISSLNSDLWYIFCV
jgi:hypothetical protein